MLSTSITLLERVRERTDTSAWDRFIKLYTPFLFHCCRRLGLDENESEDAMQDVFVLLLDKLPDFQYSQDGSFRGWLRKVTENKCRQRFRRRSQPAESATSLPSEVPAIDFNLDGLWDLEYRHHLVARALEIMQSDFEPTTWQACWQTIVEDRPVADVAGELGLTVNAVYLARCRVLRHLRTELDHLLDD